MNTARDSYATRLDNKLNAIAFELIQTNQDLVELLQQINPHDFDKRAAITSRIGRIRSLTLPRKKWEAS